MGNVCVRRTGSGSVASDATPQHTTSAHSNRVMIFMMLTAEL
jgi:hypothetical protein